MKVAYLTGQLLATSSIRLMLHEQFGADKVQEIKSSELASTDLSRFDLLVLPGSPGEVSPYPDIMGDREISNLFSAIEKDGLIVWTDCSATYYMLGDIEYMTSAGLRKTRPGLGLIDGAARGPVLGKAIAPDPEYIYNEIVIRRISYCQSDSPSGTHQTADVCYGNGPGLYLSAAEKENPAVQILGSYVDTPDSPVAGVTKKIGRGLLVSLGVLVQISPEHMRGSFPEERAEQHRQILFNNLSQVDHSRRAFLDLIMSKIRTHYTSLQSPSASPQYGALNHV